MADKSDKKKGFERGSRDDWESIKLILDEQPLLKRRVLQRIRGIKAHKPEDDTKLDVSAKQTKEFLRNEQSREREKK